MRVDIIEVAGRRGPTLQERLAALRNRRAIWGLAAAGLAAVVLAAGALVAGVSLTGGGGATATARLPTTVLPNTVLYPTYLRATGPAAASPQNADALRCLKLLIALHDPSLMNGAFDRNLPCGRARGPYTLIALPARHTGWGGEDHARRGSHRG